MMVRELPRWGELGGCVKVPHIDVFVESLEGLLLDQRSSGSIVALLTELISCAVLAGPISAVG